MSSAPTTADASLSHSSGNAAGAAGSSSGTAGLVGADGNPIQLGGLDSNQILNLLRHLPGVFNKLNNDANLQQLAEQGQLKEDAAAALSNLSQPQYSAPPPPPHLNHQVPVHSFHHHPPPPHVPHQLNDPGPSSHPRGPPNLGQLAAAVPPGQNPNAPQNAPMSSTRADMEGNVSTDEEGGGQHGSGAGPTMGTPGRTSRGKSATMSQDEWARQRKDNHKEVERRRRGNINEGINELGRIVPNGTGEKAKGAILSRAVQYIHHLKENEARNIEKWTLEKLLMDQAMGDLQSQLEDVKGMYQREKQARERAEAELAILKGVQERLGAAGAAALASASANSRSGENQNAGEEPGRRRPREDEGAEGSGGQNGNADRDGKRQRME